MKHVKFLKIYIIAMTVLYPVILFLDITDKEPFLLIDYFDYLFWAIGISGVFAYCYSKSILNLTFWKAYLPFIILWDTYVMVDAIANDPDIFPEEFGMGFVVLCAVIYIVFLLPEYIGWYFYGYRPKALKT